MDRPQFEGEPSTNPVDGRKMLYFPKAILVFRETISVAVVGVLILIVLCIIASIFVMRIYMTKSPAFVVGGVATGSIIAGIVNAVQIQVLNAIYGSVAIALNDYENHRTDTEYEDALIAKTFIFQYCNSFASLFYISFVKPYTGSIDPCLGSCMQELQAGLGTIFLTRLATGSILKLAIPYFMQKMKTKNETKGVDIEDLTDVELAFIMDEYHVMLGPFMDYANLSIQFGYATMFIVAYPLAMAMSFVSNYVGKWVFLILSILVHIIMRMHVQLHVIANLPVQ